MSQSLYPLRKYEYGTQKTEIEVLQGAHRFLRAEDEDPKKLSWDDALAHKYYSSLYREFAVCDLKHFKSGNISLRWRTEDEVLSGAGESSCGNTRCKHHVPMKEVNPPSSITDRRWEDEDAEDTRFSRRHKKRPLNTLELPFSYEEEGTQKDALVKVVLCDRCVRKLNWKREKDKETGKRKTSNTTAGPRSPRRGADNPGPLSQQSRQ